ncbi:hypothetical protein E2562_011404, partial [Oryza meyeriana var. granulata]
DSLGGKMQRHGGIGRRRLPGTALGHKGWRRLWLYRRGNPRRRRVVAAHGFGSSGGTGLGPWLGRSRQASGQGSGGSRPVQAGLEAEGLSPRASKPCWNNSALWCGPRQNVCVCGQAASVADVCASRFRCRLIESRGQVVAG